MSTEDLDEMVFHAQRERVVDEVCQLIRAFVAQEWPVGQREILDVYWSGYDATRDIQALSNMPLHLSAKDRSWLSTSNHVCYLCMVICDEDLIAQTGDVLTEPIRIMLAESASPYHVDTHLLGQDLRHRGSMGSVAKHYRLLSSQVLTIDGAGEPCRLRNEAGLLVYVLLEVKVVTPWLQKRSDGPHKLCCGSYAHWTRINVGHVELVLQVSSGHEPDFTVRHNVEPCTRELMEIVH
mmetsp:Transcript_42285/g.76652  ORF Transcript_42285/g.76652 Transcript_42285/m.76652 type:complete len:237 (-) Transcript_42285:1046-1756(-)